MSDSNPSDQKHSAQSQVVHNQVIHDDCLAWLTRQPDDSVHLILGSPPYAEKGERYGEGSRTWGTREWVMWMLSLTREAVRVCQRDVVWVVNGAMKDGAYLPAVEGLLWEAAYYESTIICERPLIWHKNAPPNRKNWFGNDWEYVVAFHKPGAARVWNWEAIGHAPAYKNGGQFRQRTANGQRRLGNQYPTGKIARPRDVIRATVGGGHLGSRLAHQNEAPYPEKLIEPFVLGLTHPGELVLDPFSGSGTTAAVCERLGRNWLAIDWRTSQVELTNKRLAERREQLSRSTGPAHAQSEQAP